MRPIDRLNIFLQGKNITAYAFEHAIVVGNGYLANQKRGKGRIGSEILEKINKQYPELNLLWLITGQGKMIVTPPKEVLEAIELREEEALYSIRNKLIALLKDQLEELESFPYPRKKEKINHNLP